MHTIVLTGGLGAGKTTAAEFFRARGATVICLDDVARHALDAGTPTLERVVEEFGDRVIRADGSLDRDALAEVVFATPEATAKLNAIVHPEVAREVGTSLGELRLMPEHQPAVVVLEVPLLAEAPVFAEIADEVLAIVAPESVRVKRAVARGMSAHDAHRRIASQATDAERAALANVVIVNDGDDQAAFEHQLDQYWEERVANHGAPAQ